MPVCSYIRANGERCRAWPIKGESFCYGHHPDYAEVREEHGRKGARLGGRGRGARKEIHEVKATLRQLADDVLNGSVDRADASTAGYLLNIWLRGTEVERRVRELDDVAERIEMLERAVSEARRGRKWGS